MKHFILILTVIGFLYSCNSNTENNNSSTATTNTDTQQGTHTLDITKTVVKWHGQKKLVDSHHNGTVKVANGFLNVANGNINSGTIVIDMNSIDNEDLKGTEKIGDLIGHLKSPDFFDVARFPTATLEITGTHALTNVPNQTHTINAKLTLKGKTNNVSFPANIVMSEDRLTATAKFSIDRTLWDVQYGSDNFFKNLGDKVIANNLDFEVSLVAKEK